MQVKVFKFDKNGKVSFTQAELEKLLNEVYRGGYDDGKRANNYWTWTSPYWTSTTYNNTCNLKSTNTITSTSNPNITWTTSTSGDNCTIATMNTDDTYTVSANKVTNDIYTLLA